MKPLKAWFDWSDLIDTYAFIQLLFIDIQNTANTIGRPNYHESVREFLSQKCFNEGKGSVPDENMNYSQYLHSHILCDWKNYEKKEMVFETL